MQKPAIQELFIDARVEMHPRTQAIIKQLPEVKKEIITDKNLASILNTKQLTQGKKALFLTRNEGGAVKPCPGTNPPYLCCQYTVISQIHQCPFDCTYCILQHYLDSGLMTVFVNLEDIFHQIDALLSDHPNRFFRFGTGEFGDSLALEPIIQTGPDIIDFFGQKSNCLIELKTKSIAIDPLLNLKPKNAVLAWSVNPQTIVQNEEFRSAPLKKRLDAARRAMDAGYLLAFHFDPMLYFSGWETDYQRVVDDIFNTVEGSRIAWISIGSLRYPPDLKKIIQRRFPRSSIVYEEMIQGRDGKSRYLRHKRVRLYQTLVNRIRRHDPDVFVYFCMESPDVWETVMGQVPADNAELDYWFAESCQRRFPELKIRDSNPSLYPKLT